MRNLVGAGEVSENEKLQAKFLRFSDLKGFLKKFVPIGLWR